MIIDKVENINYYNNILPNIGNAMSKLQELESYEISKHTFDGGFLMIQKGKTKHITDGTYEAHRKYIDVQVILEGCEELAWDDLNDLKTEIPYNAEKDAERLNGNLEHHMLISKGMFYAAFPHDGHKPVSHTEKEHEYLKCVIKLECE